MPFAASTLALGGTLVVAHEPRGWRGWVRFAAMLPAFLVFTMGLALHNGLAALGGLVGPPGGEFVRTAKTGGASWRGAAYSGRSVDRRLVRELLFLGWLVAGLVIAWQRREPAFVPLQVMAVGGLVWVLTLSLLHPWQACRLARHSFAASRPPALEGVAP